MTLNSTILLVTIFVNLLLGLSVYIQSRRDRGTLSFFMIVTSIFLWATPLFFYGLTNYEPLALNLSRLSYFAAAMSALSLLNFAVGFASEQKSPSSKRIIVRAFNVLTVIGFVCLSSSQLLLTGHSVFNSVRTITFGPAYPFYIAFVTLAFFTGLFIVGLRHKKETKTVVKKQLLLIFWGILFAIIGGFVTNLILPTVLSDFSLYWLGPVFTLVMVGFFTLSILKYQLFNLKVVATQLFMFLLWIVLVLYVASPVAESIWPRILVLTSVVVIGIFVIRSVIKEVRQREQIQKLAEELGESNNRQEKLIHFIGHEVKGYLTKGEYAFAEMADGDVGALPAETKVLATTALAELRKGVASVTDILQAANLKRGTVTYDMKPVDLKDVVKEEVIKTKPQADEKGLALEVSMDESQTYMVSLDRGQFNEHVIRNLIDNAVKYTPQGGVTVGLLKKDGKILFSVKDTGVGISQEDRAHLFTEGGRGKDSMKINVHSTGYGLYIAKGIVEAHGGRIWVESPASAQGSGEVKEGEGKGSTFFVELPVV